MVVAPEYSHILGDSKLGQATSVDDLHRATIILAHHGDRLGQLLQLLREAPAAPSAIADRRACHELKPMDSPSRRNDLRLEALAHLPNATDILHPAKGEIGVTKVEQMPRADASDGAII